MAVPKGARVTMGSAIEAIRAAGPYVIAEVANAHNGDPRQLEQLIEAVHAAGCDAVKLHWYKYDHLALPEYPWYEHYVRLFFDEPVWDVALTRCRRLGLEVWVDVFDTWGAELAERWRDRVAGFKIPPTVALEPELPLRVLRLGKPTLLGVGGHDKASVDRLIKRFSGFGDQLILMHGFQAYPTKREDAKLGRLRWLENRYGGPVGYADHVSGDAEEALKLPESAVFAGAQVIEKHLCLDRSLKGYDYYSSLEPDEMKELVGRLRRCRVLIGDNSMGEAERAYLREAATRAVVAQAIGPGDWLLPEHIIYRRVNDQQALLPDEMAGRLPGVAERSLDAGSPIGPGHIRKLRIVPIVACRLKSTRLRAKALLPLFGVPSIERCLLNALEIPWAGQVVLATSTHPDDSPLERVTLEGRVAVFRGSEEDVLQRLLDAAAEHRADIVLRITGDCPVISYEIAQRLIASHIRERADCTFCEGYAVGTACEVYTVDALRRLRRLKPETNYSEYLLFYFRNNPEHFRLNAVTLPAAYQHPEWRLTLDEPPDAELFNRLFEGLGAGREPVAFERIAGFFERQPEAALINRGVRLRWVEDRELLELLNRVTRIGPETEPAPVAEET